MYLLSTGVWPQYCVLFSEQFSSTKIEPALLKGPAPLPDNRVELSSVGLSPAVEPGLRLESWPFCTTGLSGRTS